MKLFRRNPDKPRSPLKVFLSQAWFALMEDYRYRKAMNNLAKLDWSMDFLVNLLKRANDDQIQLRIENNGVVLTVSKIRRQEAGVADITEFEQQYRNFVGFYDNE